MIVIRNLFSRNIFKQSFLILRMKKEKYALIIGFLLVSVMFIPFIIGQGFGGSFENFVITGTRDIAPFFGLLFGTTVDDLLFAKVLVFFLLFSIIFMVIRNNDILGGNRAVSVIITFAVSILAIRFMGDNEFIAGILLPYGVMGAALVLFLPLLIYFLFVNSSVPGGFARRLAWGIYGIVFVVMWGMRSSDIGPVNWIYTGGLIFVILNILFDSAIHGYFGSREFRKTRQAFHLEQKGRVAEKLQDLERRKDFYSLSEYNRLKNKLERKYKSHAKSS